MNLPIVAVAIIGVALFFDFINGFHDSSNVVATMISSRAMSARKALAMSAAAHFCGPFLFGVAVATTIGHEVIDPKAITVAVIFAALLAAIVWNIITWAFGIPSSSSHALVGGLIGAVSVDFGLAMIQMRGLAKVIIALFISPILGLIIGYLLMRLVLFLSRGASPRINWAFKRSQIMTSLALALSHGTNDAQKTMGIIAMSLVTLGYLSEFSVPWWVIALSAGAMSLGTAFGGWRIIRTLGTKFYKIRPVHGFTAQIASAFIILGAAFLGGPVSTTQVVSSAILGVGSARHVSRVRWNVVGNRSFITPIDREDIFALSLTIDDILDYGNSTVDEMVILEVESNPYLRRMVSLVREAANEIYMGVLRLQDHPNVANDHAVRAKALENRVETVYREALAELFHRPTDIDQIMDMLKLREIYRHLSNAADRGDQAANVIGDIVVKMT